MYIDLKMSCGHILLFKVSKKVHKKLKHLKLFSIIKKRKHIIQI